MEHPAVHQCVTFAMPHDMLGEEVAAAIVLRQGTPATDKELREFASARLAPYKVPKKILILDRDSGWRDGQAAAHRTRTKVGARMTTIAEPTSVPSPRTAAAQSA